MPVKKQYSANPSNSVSNTSGMKMRVNRKTPIDVSTPKAA